MNMKLEPSKEIISSLLTTGLHILAGSPKVGKSWLCLQIAYKIATGEEVFNLKTASGTTLYLCLEDSKSRMKSRLLNVADDGPANMHFVINDESVGSLESGCLVEQIESFLTEHIDTKLIIIDTLQMVRKSSGDYSYASDYNDMSIFKSIADKYNLAIILVHHLRKQHDSNSFNMVSGTTGITGCADSTFILVKENDSSSKAKLKCKGRDIEYRELELEFDSELHIWNILSDSINKPNGCDDEYIRLVYEYIRTIDKSIFFDTAASLVEQLKPLTNKQLHARVLSSKLNAFQEDLFDMGVVFESKKSNGVRKLLIQYNPQNGNRVATLPTPIIVQLSMIGDTLLQKNIIILIC